jgi:type VI secretion system protein ImpH
MEEAQAWTQGFGPLLRRLAAEHPELPPVGQAQRPQQEAFKLGQVASLTFAPREIAELSRTASGKLFIRLFGLGMLGPNGPLPLHMTEQVRERVQSRRDHTLGDFLDLFHHRALSHQHRAWAQAQAAAGLDRPGAETFTPYVARLAGDESELAEASALAPHARWASAAHRVRAARNPDGLVATLAHYFGVPVALREHCLHWMALEPQDQCHLGVPRQSSLLGQGAIAGEVVPDRQTRFRLILGPLSLEQYLRFTPEGAPGGGRDLPALVEIVRASIGFEYAWEVELLVRRDRAPPCRMGDDTQLGWSTWMGTPATGSEALSGMVFEPEAYTATAAATAKKGTTT